MAYRVRSDVQTITRTDPDGNTVTYSQAPGNLQIPNSLGQIVIFRPGDIYPDWAYEIYSNPRVIEIISE